MAKMTFGKFSSRFCPSLVNNLGFVSAERLVSVFYQYLEHLNVWCSIKNSSTLIGFC